MLDDKEEEDFVAVIVAMLRKVEVVQILKGCDRPLAFFFLSFLFQDSSPSRGLPLPDICKALNLAPAFSRFQRW